MTGGYQGAGAGGDGRQARRCQAFQSVQEEQCFSRFLHTVHTYSIPDPVLVTRRTPYCSLGFSHPAGPAPGRPPPRRLPLGRDACVPAYWKRPSRGGCLGTGRQPPVIGGNRCQDNIRRTRRLCEGGEARGPRTYVWKHIFGWSCFWQRSLPARPPVRLRMRVCVSCARACVLQRELLYSDVEMAEGGGLVKHMT